MKINQRKIIRHLDLFGGIGAMRYSLNKLGYKVESDYIDFDKKVVNVYNHIYNENHKPIDIRNFNPIKPNYDLITAGFPCQPFSVAGKGQGLHDEKGRGDLFLETLRVIKQALPDYVIFENVKGILSKNHKWIIDEIVKEMENLGYSVMVKLLNSHDFNSIQTRQRVFIMCTVFSFYDQEKELEKLKQPLTKTLKDYLELKPSETLYYGPEKLEKILKWKAQEKPLSKITTTTTATKTITTRTQPGTSSQLVVADNVGGVEKINLNDILNNRTRIPELFYKTFNAENYITGIFSPRIGTITASGANSKQKILLKDLRIRSITPRETFRLMGFDDEMFDKIEHLPKTNLYFTAGNSMEVNTITAVLKFLIRKTWLDDYND